MGKAAERASLAAPRAFGPAYEASRALLVGMDLHVGKRGCKELCEGGQGHTIDCKISLKFSSLCPCPCSVMLPPLPSRSTVYFTSP